MIRSVCIRCGANKELPLARCSSCGAVPQKSEAPLALLASTRMLTEPELEQVRVRIQRGEQLKPTAARMEQARALLAGAPTVPSRNLKPLERGALVAISILLTPLCALAVAWTYRDAPAGKQAAIIAVFALIFDLMLVASALFS